MQGTSRRVIISQNKKEVEGNRLLFGQKRIERNGYILVSKFRRDLSSESHVRNVIAECELNWNLNMNIDTGTNIVNL